jgi:SAM-dependent methyltransferase
MRQINGSVQSSNSSIACSASASNFARISARVGDMGTSTWDVLSIHQFAPKLKCTRSLVGLIESIPFSADQFDVALCSFMIFHMPDDTRRKGITEIYRVLKSGGSCWLWIWLHRPSLCGGT